MTHITLSDSIEVETKMVAGFRVFEITQDDGESGDPKSVTLVSDEMDGLMNFAAEEMGI